MSPKTALVTGAAGAFGRWISLRLHERGWDVVLVCRQKAQAEEAISWIRETAKGDGQLIAEQCDLGSYRGIKAFAEAYVASGRDLHCLVNNAVSSPRKRSETSDGLEVQFGVNVMAYVWLARGLWPALVRSGKQGDPARIVNVASWYAGGLDVADPEFKNRAYEANKGYTQSKQANRMLTTMFAEKYPEFKEGNLWICSVYPAYSPSKLTKDLGTSSGAPDDPSQGAVAPVWCATDPKLARPETAGYWVPDAGKSEPEEYAKDRKAMAALWKYVEETTERLESAASL
ncbi:hypothetical protein DFJ74DRAFT_702495 [Hyaloraphidium curvatum]|nr:hypothetical protein DFJ74DRAFT_702495 [Hyaloraphidium curvatum]